jgi:hypothetical protein
MKWFQILWLANVLCFIPCAHAYIDPGSGSFMLQMLVASLIGGSLTIKMYFKNIKEKLKNLFCRTKHSKVSRENTSENET